MAGQLFISHANADARVAAELCQALEGRGFSCWLASRDVAPGENFQAAIVRAIRQAKILLLVFTSAANSSDEVAKELALASQAKAPVVPLKVEDVAPSEALAYEFATRQWIDFHTDWGRAVEQLCRHLSGALAAEGETAPAVAAVATLAAAPAAAPLPGAAAAATGDGSGRWVPVSKRERMRERRQGRALRRPDRGPAGVIRLLILLIIAAAVAVTVVLPKLKEFLTPAAPANATEPAAAHANATNSEVPF